jgi:hypothetical protein
MPEGKACCPPKGLFCKLFDYNMLDRREATEAPSAGKLMV